MQKTPNPDDVSREFYPTFKELGGGNASKILQSAYLDTKKTR